MPNKEPTGLRGPAVRRAVPLPGSAGPPEPDALPDKTGDASGPSSTSAPGEAPAPPAPPASFEPASSARAKGSTGSAASGPTASFGFTAPKPPASFGTAASGPTASAGSAASESAASESAESEPAASSEPSSAPDPAAGPEAASGGEAGTSEATPPTTPAAAKALTGSAASATGSTAGPASSSSEHGGGRGAGAAGVTAAAFGGKPPEASTGTGGGEEPPSGRPTKALRAAAAIAGALLIAVPLLALGRGGDDKEKTAAAAAEITVPKGDDLRAPGSYTGKSPSIPPKADKGSKDKKDGEKADGVKSGSDGKAPSGAPASGKDKKGGEKGKPAAPAAKIGLFGGPGPGLLGTKQLQLRNVMTGMCADIPGYGGKGKINGEVDQFTCIEPRSSDNEMWDVDVKLKGKAPGGGDLFVIRNSTDGLCMDLPGYGAVPGATGVSEYTCDGTLGDNQLWWKDDRGNGKFWLRNYTSNNMCLDVWGKEFGTGGPAARLGVADCNPADDHEWRFS
ncbi:RICIN domain-containing protein [Streptomyces sp. NPDC054765]